MHVRFHCQLCLCLQLLLFSEQIFLKQTAHPELSTIANICPPENWICLYGGFWPSVLQYFACFGACAASILLFLSCIHSILSLLVFIVRKQHCSRHITPFWRVVIIYLLQIPSHKIPPAHLIFHTPNPSANTVL